MSVVNLSLVGNCARWSFSKNKKMGQWADSCEPNVILRLKRCVLTLTEVLNAEKNKYLYQKLG